MPVVKARYKGVPRQTRSSTTVTLQLPFPQLFQQFVDAFLAESLEKLATGRRIADPLQLTAAEGIVAALETLKGDSTCAAQPRLAVPATVSGFMRAAGTADDLAAEKGGWQEVLKERVQDVGESAQQLVDRVRAAANCVQLEYGPAAAQQLLHDIVRDLLGHRTEVQAELDRFHGHVRLSAKVVRLCESAEQFRRIARSVPWWKRLLLFCVPALSTAWLLDAGDRYRAQKLVGQVNDAYRDRLRLVWLQERLTVLDSLMGAGESRGRLTAAVDAIEHHQHYLRSLGQLRPAPSQSADHPCNLILADSLAAVIDHDSSRTLGDLYFERLAQAGFSSDRFSELLRTQGVVVADRPHLPDEWSQVEPAELTAALREAALRFLGADDADRPINLDEPQTGLEHFTAVVPSDETLRPLVNQFISKIARHAAPFARIRPLTDVDPRPQGFLYCHKNQRKTWEALLRNHVPLCIPANATEAAAFHVRNPHIVALVTGVLGIPGGALDQFQRWMATGNLSRREHSLPPMFPRDSLPESRLVPERETSHEYAEQLFQAADKARQVHAVGHPPTAYALSRPDSRVDHLFMRRALVPSWHPAEHFHDLLKQGHAFANFVEREFTSLAGFRHHTADRMAQQLNAQSMAEELVSLGVLDRNPSRQYRVRCIYSGTLDGLTELLFTPQPGQVVGLSRDAFIAAIQRDDELHNLLFWSVLDAFQQGLLAEFDVPEFVRRYSESLQ